MFAVLISEQAVPTLSIKPIQRLKMGEARQMNRRNLAVGASLITLSAAATLTVFVSANTVLQTINPFAALAAVTVAIIGIVWFKKTSN